MSPAIAVVWKAPGLFGDSDYHLALRKAGGRPRAIPLGVPVETIRSVVADCAGLLISGGADIAPELYGQEMICSCDLDPVRDEVDRWALDEALSRDLPVLGICRGIQALAAFLGGELLQDIQEQRPGSLNHRLTQPDGPRLHEVEVFPGTRLAAVVGPGRLSVNSRHHQAVSRLPHGFRTAAEAPDGIVEAIESTTRPCCLGVQWHPENLAVKQDEGAERHRALFAWLVRAAKGDTPDA
jgi:putative glutamine amidotransferase